MSKYIQPPIIEESPKVESRLNTQTQPKGEMEAEGSCRIRVPASSGNLGPGFDTLGIALILHNLFEINLNVSDFNVELIRGMDQEFIPKCRAMVKEAADLFFERSALPNRPFQIKIENQIPIARGLASSATLRLAVLFGLDYLLKASMPTKSMLQWASELEGCTDNVASSYYGGMTASAIIKNRLICYRFNVSEELDFVAVSPINPVETYSARTIFTESIPREDAVFNLHRGILLAMAFAQSDYESMRDLFDDKLHQPQRQTGIPALYPLYDVLHAAKEAGAVGAYLSGSGSTMMAMTVRNKEAIAGAMQNAIAKYNMNSKVRYLKADNKGLTIEA